MKKICFVAKKYQPFIRGAHYTGLRVAERFPQYCDYVDIAEVESVEELRERYERLVFLTQIYEKSKYGGKYNLTKSKATDIVFVRDRGAPGFINAVSNGFKYFKTSKNLKGFIPIVTGFEVSSQPRQDICLGFYSYPTMRRDSYSYFIDFLKKNNIPIRVYVMGQWEHKMENLTFTMDNVEFFQNVTHYMQVPSKTYVDPFPNTLVEAVDNGCQIIIPDIKRDFEDGIDDIASCIQYHTELNPSTYLDNSNTILNYRNFDDYYLRLFENDFDYFRDKTMYNNFKEWCENEL